MMLSNKQVTELTSEELLLRVRVTLMAYQTGLRPVPEVKDGLLWEIDELLAREGLVLGWSARGGVEK